MYKELSATETRELLDAKGVDSSGLEAFAYLDQDRDIRYDWHAHARHQLMYAFSGTLRLETEHSIYLLPPQRAVWIPAGVSHRTILHNVLSGSVFFAPHLVPSQQAKIRIITAPPIVREMVRYALRWPPDRQTENQLADSYFATLGLLCAEWIEDEMPFCLPVAESRQIGAAIDYALAHLGEASLAGAAKTAALSERQFRRRFASETGIGWQQFLFQARMLRAMELLALPDTSVTEVVYELGLNSPSAFAKSFRRFTGQTPNQYRRHCKER